MGGATDDVEMVEQNFETQVETEDKAKLAALIVILAFIECYSAARDFFD
jgi:hypothetical protein